MSGIKMSIKMEGLDELRQALRLLPENLQKKHLANAVHKGAIVTRDDARPRVLPDLQTPDPRRKAGTLRRAIRATRGKRNRDIGSAYVYVRRLTKKAISKFKKGRAAAGKTVRGADNPDDPFYWTVLEFSKSKDKARPFLRPAFEHTKREAAERIKTALREGLEKEAANVKGRTFR